VVLSGVAWVEVRVHNGVVLSLYYSLFITNIFQMLMNVKMKLTIVAKMQTAPTVQVHITASVSVDTRGTGRNA
jgi:hypothetical protein